VDKLTRWNFLEFFLAIGSGLLHFSMRRKWYF
jgi:hypothetical protein